MWLGDVIVLLGCRTRKQKVSILTPGHTTMDKLFCYQAVLLVLDKERCCVDRKVITILVENNGSVGLLVD